MSIWRAPEIKTIRKQVHIQANNETVNLNLLKFTKTIQIFSQYAHVLEAINTTNILTAHLDLWDGVNSVNLSKPNTDMSGIDVGCVFTKNLMSSEDLTILASDQVRFMEIDAKDFGRPFIINAKAGVDNYIRFNFVTNTITDFKADLVFKYVNVDGGSIWFV